MQIFIKYLNFCHSIEVSESDTIENIKAIIQSLQNIRVSKIKLIFAGILLNDENILIDYGIEKESTLHAVVA